MNKNRYNMKQLLKSQAIAMQKGDLVEVKRLSLLISKEDKSLNGDTSFDLLINENFKGKIVN